MTLTKSTRLSFVAERGSSRVQSSLVDRCSRLDASCKDSSTDMAKETQTDQINLPQDERKTIKLLVQYLYEGEYDPALPFTASQTTMLTVVAPARHDSTTSKSPFPPHTCRGIGFGSFDSYTCSNDQYCPHNWSGSDCMYTCKGFSREACVVPNLIGPLSQLRTPGNIYKLADNYNFVILEEFAKKKLSRGCKHL
jgi:hypothetical protein